MAHLVVFYISWLTVNEVASVILDDNTGKSLYLSPTAVVCNARSC